jgi:hypothetical protein
MKYPAFRHKGQEIQIGDLVQRESHRRSWAPGIGIVIETPIVAGKPVKVMWSDGVHAIASQILEVIGECR